MLLTTHYMFEADTLCDSIGIINKGKLAALGTPAEIKGTFSTVKITQLTLRTPVPELVDEISSLEEVQRVTEGTGGRHAAAHSARLHGLKPKCIPGGQDAGDRHIQLSSPGTHSGRGVPQHPELVDSAGSAENTLQGPSPFHPTLDSSENKVSAVPVDNCCHRFQQKLVAGRGEGGPIKGRPIRNFRQRESPFPVSGSLDDDLAAGVG